MMELAPQETLDMSILKNALIAVAIVTPLILSLIHI